MGLSVDVKIDKKQVREMFNSLKSKQVRKVAQQAINKTLGNTKAEINRQVRQDRALKKGQANSRTPVKMINERMSLKKASGLRSLGNVSGGINVSRRGMSLIRYGAKQTKKGVIVKIKKNGGRKLIKHAFIATLNNGNVHVTKRVRRLTLKSLYSTNVADAATNKLKTIKSHMSSRFVFNLNAALSNAIRRSR